MQFHEKNFFDLFDFTRFFARTFFNFLAHCGIIWKKIREIKLLPRQIYDPIEPAVAERYFLDVLDIRISKPLQKNWHGTQWVPNRLIWTRQKDINSASYDRKSLRESDSLPNQACKPQWLIWIQERCQDQRVFCRSSNCCCCYWLFLQMNWSNFVGWPKFVL